MGRHALPITLKTLEEKINGRGTIEIYQNGYIYLLVESTPRAGFPPANWMNYGMALMACWKKAS